MRVEMYQFFLAFASFFSLITTTTSSPCNFMSTSLQKLDGNCGAVSDFEKPRSMISKLRGAPPEPPPACPANIQVSWLDRHPFIFKNTTNQNQSDPVGVFVDLLRSSLSVCCRVNGSPPPNISFDITPARNLEELHSKVNKDNTDRSLVIMPVNVCANEKYFGMLSAVPVLQSPGEVLLLDRERFDLEEQNKVWKSIGGVWLTVALSVLLSLVAGVCIWALETLWNPDDFPNAFGKGVTEGFWWAFVTMTTVGYGDRTPKSLFGRLFGVVWTVFGISLCGIMTATITTALTSVNVNHMEYDIMDKKIAVYADDNHAITETMKRFGIPRVFHDYESMRDALTNNQVDGIMMETNAGIYRLYDSDNQLHIGNVYKSLHHYGFAHWHGAPSFSGEYYSSFNWRVDRCLVNIFKYRGNDVDMMIEKFLKRDHRKIKSKEVVGFFSMKFPLFKKIFIALSAVCGLIVVLGLLEQFYHHRRKTQDCNKTIDSITEELGVDKHKFKDSSTYSLGKVVMF